MNRREFMKLSAAAAGAIAGEAVLHANFVSAAKSSAVSKAVADSAVKSMFFKVTYTTKIINPSKGDENVSIWIPLPQSDEEQDITSLSVSSPHAFSIHEEPYYGNRIIYTGRKVFRKGDNITVSYSIRRKAAGVVTYKDDDVGKHLVLTDREKWDENITAFVDKLLGEEKDPLETGRKIFYALADFLTYDKEIPGCGEGRSIWTFQGRRGRCDDFHALFRTMMIYKGIPTRWEQGIALPYPSVITKSGKFEGDCTGAHCWVRFHTGDGNWIPVDVSEAHKRKDMRDYFFGTLSPNRFKVSTGRDIVLKPAQAESPLNSFPYAYAESDGVPLIYGHNYRNIIRYELMKTEV
ncbi:MAG: twin-arginine translocation signal domain-containing protein [Nitrospiraceae bacterium]|nr:MAG: twin-arginine translocation signal domain-containing protein [Nitrospiraceae bacterium]